ncbi:MAG: DUF1460 domain-containing protein [Gemmatimonadales bacterium]|nr:MAG: DUF1460 domain-containing protein [Gemmatimonadales bacterium]
MRIQLVRFPVLLLPAFLLLPVFLWAGGCTPSDADAGAAGPAEALDARGEVAVADTLATHGPDPEAETEMDWHIARDAFLTLGASSAAGLEPGERTAQAALGFLGAPYIPATLEIPGPERLVVNLRGFDCVTLVEHALTLARLAAEAEPALADDDQAFQARYRAELARLRYREGEPDGYLSRLHYFTEWLDRGIEAGELREVTGELGGVPDPRPIHFMSSNPDAYRQLAAAPELVEEVRRLEAELSARPRLYIPQERIREVEGGIRDGDIIAAVSALDGLDIAHTGFALRRDGRVHLLHAPLVGDSVEVSPRPLAERIQAIGSQTGIRVVRPVR